MKKTISILFLALIFIFFAGYNSVKTKNLKLLCAISQNVAKADICVGTLCMYVREMACVSCYPECPDEPCDVIEDHIPYSQGGGPGGEG